VVGRDRAAPPVQDQSGGELATVRGSAPKVHIAGPFELELGPWTS
jgi:hypothetical protein